MHPLRALIGVLPVALVLVVSGCSGSGDSQRPGVSVTSISPTADAGPASEPVEPTTESPTLGPTPAPVIFDGSDDEYFSFVTPSKNIRCAIYPSDPDTSKGHLRCDVLTGTWALPPMPVDCEFDWNRSMELETRAQAGACVSDAVDVQGARTVAYNSGVRWHNITCISQTTGLSCTNTNNQAGFTVSRSAYTIR